MARTITTITDWNNVNWDEIDFDHFERDSLMDADLDQVATFLRHQKHCQEQDRQGFAEEHFKRALLEGRDPRSDRLFGEYHQIYQKLIDKYIPVSHPWDLTGIEHWPDEAWSLFNWSEFRMRFVDREHPNYSNLNSRYVDFHSKYMFERDVTLIDDWNHVNWFAIDFDHYDEDSLDNVPEEFRKEYYLERGSYIGLWSIAEASKRKWNGVNFAEYDWSGEKPEISDLDLENRQRAEDGYRVWSENKRKAADEEWERSQRLGHEFTKSSREPETEQQQLTRLLGQAGITLPDEA